METPRDFFETKAKPSYWDWRDEPLAEHRALALFGFANGMAEQMFHHLALEKKVPHTNVCTVWGKGRSPRQW